MSYWRFAAMIATSTVVMFGLMYLNTYLISHVFWSETRAYMALLMGATMAIIMLAFMLSMYSSKAINTAIFAGAAIAFAGSLWLVRSQATVGERQQQHPAELVVRLLQAHLSHLEAGAFASARGGVLRDP